MKRIFARISMEIEIEDDEFMALFRQSEDGRYDIDLDDELATRFLREGTLNDDSYIPGSVLEKGR